MLKNLTAEIDEVIETIPAKPAVSLILPFEPKMMSKAELNIHLKQALETVTHRIQERYEKGIAVPMIERIRSIFSHLNFDTHKRTLAIYLSLVFEKVLYLDIPVEEKIIVNDSFEIRDLVYAKKELHKYLVLQISGRCSKVFIGNSSTFIRIKSNVPDHIEAFDHDEPERTSNFSDPAARKEILLKKFLHQTDEGLTYILQSYPLPVFVLGVPKVAGYFKALTKNTSAIIDYVHGNFDDASEHTLKLALTPFIADWKRLKMTELLRQMEKAANDGKLALGIKEVYAQAALHKGRKLIVEKNYMYPSVKDKNVKIPIAPFNKNSCIHDVVDDLIEKILQDGGDVEFVDAGSLGQYGQIALIQYY
ncbi:hypothetical protein [Flavihumibacter fluvii]|uniref:baeRF3 domain-containing protein n=1 Tax=Flavihumibacter fluvii TaxID=2838157 RepID=UPI001BDEE774|nr:hypothetical protein [Flavihumibacter fluvii]ULQ53818.1 hypothetical protein KJS93_05725 [Flavihumibacter fluvii]